jgi:hypothetical protein
MQNMEMGKFIFKIWQLLPSTTLRAGVAFDYAQATKANSGNESQLRQKKPAQATNVRSGNESHFRILQVDERYLFSAHQVVERSLFCVHLVVERSLFCVHLVVERSRNHHH